VVEDDPQVRSMLRMTLEEAVYETGEAADGLEALRVLRENPVDLVITDILMPEKDGLGTIMDLRKEVSGPKVIAVSGGGSVVQQSFLSHAKLLGAARTFQKPVDRQELLGAIRELLDAE